MKKALLNESRPSFIPSFQSIQTTMATRTNCPCTDTSKGNAHQAAKRGLRGSRVATEVRMGRGIGNPTGWIARVPTVISYPKPFFRPAILSASYLVGEKR
ncbi:hypothetical protein L1987_53143 [Smallanthus sonchifolius]|uniref:Uncharacterized protein n=1 Tax=Smallanthus sonchifolius TaxID=185202 RepID=A0ACB9EWA2_9ASTR|nr:hypothetical protein L1987_53143 [Smallanthus sonchifolius]